MGLFGRSKNEEQPSESLFEDKIKCDNCGKEYNKSDMRKCKKCGAVICPECRATHVCNVNIHENKIQPKTSNQDDDSHENIPEGINVDDNLKNLEFALYCYKYYYYKSYNRKDYFENKIKEHLLTALDSGSIEALLFAALLDNSLEHIRYGLDGYRDDECLMKAAESGNTDAQSIICGLKTEYEVARSMREKSHYSLLWLNAGFCKCRISPLIFNKDKKKYLSNIANSSSNNIELVIDDESAQNKFKDLGDFTRDLKKISKLISSCIYYHSKVEEATDYTIINNMYQSEDTARYKAVKNLINLADSGCIEAQLFIGVAREECRLNIEDNLRKKYLIKAADSGCVEAQLILANIGDIAQHMRLISNYPDLWQYGGYYHYSGNREKYVVMAADAGNVDAQLSICFSDAYNLGLSFEDNVKIKWLKHFADNGDFRATIKLSKIGSPNERSKILFDLYEKSKSLEYLRDLVLLYVINSELKDVDKVISLAKEVSSEYLTEISNVISSNKLILSDDEQIKYDIEYYILRDLSKLLYHHHQNHEGSAYWLVSVMNVTQHFKYALSTEIENSSVYSYIASCYENGDDELEQNDENAVIYYLKAANMGDSAAQAALVELYYEGSCGLPKNEAKVKYWLNLAIKQDNVRALNFLEAHPELKENGVKNINYHADGDIIQGDVGVYAKDDAIVNRANISNDKEDVISNEAVVTSLNQNSEIHEYKFCIYCGAKLPAESRFCMKCGKEIKPLE